MENKKTFIVTGGNSGLGYETAKNIAKASENNYVILACRNANRAKEAVEKMLNETGNRNITTLELDLASLASIRKFADRYAKAGYPPLSGLICNAGGIFVDKTSYTTDGFEVTFGINHLGHFLLTNLLLSQMCNDGRILFVSSATHDPASKTGIASPKYTNAKALAYPMTDETESMLKIGQRRYTTSKLCNIYCAYEFANQLRTNTDKEITVNAFDPGQMPGTGFSRTFPSVAKVFIDRVQPFLNRFKPNADSVEKSGAILASLAVDPKFENITGKYFSGGQEVASSELSYNKENQKELWRSSIELTKLKQSETILPVTLK